MVHPFGILSNLYTVCIDFCINYQNKTKLARSCSQTYLERLLIHKRRPTINFVRDIVGSSFPGRHISSELLHTSCQPLTSRNTCFYYLCLTFSKANETWQSTVLLVCKQKYKKKKRKAIISVSYCSLIVVCYFSTLLWSPASAQQWHILTLSANVMMYWLFLFVGGWICKYHGLLNAGLHLCQVCARTKSAKVGPVGSDLNVSFGLFLVPLGSSPFLPLLHLPHTRWASTSNVLPFLNVVSAIFARWKYITAAAATVSMVVGAILT